MQYKLSWIVVFSVAVDIYQMSVMVPDSLRGRVVLCIFFFIKLRHYSIWYRVRRRKLVKNNYLFFYNLKYCLCYMYKAITKLHLHSIYCICLNCCILFLTISLLKLWWPPDMFYDNSFTHLKSFAEILIQTFVTKL